MSDHDPFDLARFVTAQDSRGTYEQAVRELRAGDKRSHWMWFVFPQIQGLGRSPTAQRYAVTGLAEARAYLAHPVLGPRLRECTAILTELPGHDAAQVLGGIDALKLRSSLTLFAEVAEEPFRTALEKYFEGHPDEATLANVRI